MTPRPAVQPPPSRTRRGVILILVLWIFAALTLFMYAFLRTAGVDYRISAGSADRFRALEIARSATELTIAWLLEDDTPADGSWDDWFDNPARYREIDVPDPGGDDAPYGRYSVIAADYATDAPALRFGAQDEAAKINLNTATRDVLLKLSPHMTEEIADAIIDWRDADDRPGASGAEDGYYTALQPGYHCKNAPFESVEELLYVRGVDALLLYGEDWNRNGLLDPAENDGDRNDPPDDGDGRLEYGLWHLCTVYSYDLNTTNAGKARVNVNTASEQQLRTALGTLATGNQIDAVVKGRGKGAYTNLADLLDLPGWDVRTFQAVADLVTLTDAKKIPGLVNVNTAPVQVLEALPGMTEDLANAIVQYRTKTETPPPNIGWLLNAINRNAFRRIAGLVTSRASQFSIQAVGWIPSQRGLPPVYGRVWTVMDLESGAPKELAFKDLTSLGFPYRLDETGLTRAP